jgi:hypothetical protein
MSPARNRFLFVFAILLCLFATPPARAQEATLGFAALEEVPCNGLSFDVTTNPNTGQTVVTQPRRYELSELAVLSGTRMGIAEKPNFGPASTFSDRWHSLPYEYEDQFLRLLSDYRNMYCSERILGLGLVLAIAAPIANTHADQGIRDWYQKHGRSRTADEIANAGRQLGDHWVVLPFMIGASLGGRLIPDDYCGDVFSEWGDRSLRALMVGAPAVGLLQIGLGSSRPGETGSHWRPFHDNNGVAGHGFVGAVPFLAAASMTECQPLRWLLVAGSFWTTWSRIHDDSHYTSQALLGWTIAFLATQAVGQTQFDASNRVSFQACDIPNGVGVGVMFKY